MPEPVYCTDNRRLGVFFGVFCIASAFLMGNLTQSTAIYEAVFPHGGAIEKAALSAVLFAVLLITLSGGFESISKISSALVPLMGVLYLGTALYDDIHLPERNNPRDGTDI